MSKKEVIILEKQVGEAFLPFVRRPSRYIGGETNQIRKDLHRCDLTVALCFPDTYEVGMSYTGMAVIYDILNRMDGIAGERVFAPWPDAENLMRHKNIPLFSIESKADVGSFDIIGFSLPCELCYTNVLNMLDLAGLRLRSTDRAGSDPIVIAGGGMTNCCEPLAEFIDLFVLGEGEEAVVELVELIRVCKKKAMAKKDILIEAARRFSWVYVPCLYKFEYEGAQIKAVLQVSAGLPKRLENAIVEDFENAPVPMQPIVPFEAVQERVSVEIMRGCPGRCRFCQASFCRRPIRHRSIEKIIDIARSCYLASGFDTVSLLSLSTADYPNLERLISGLHEYFNDKFVGLSLPSLRVDQQLKLIPELMTAVRKGGLTIAVEAASEKVRKAVNKPLKDEDLFAAVEAAYRAGWSRLKLYFMVGLPGETPQDIEGIVNLSVQLAVLCRKVNGKTGQINVAVSWFVPKPHTPLGWLAQRPKSYFEDAKKAILQQKKKLRANFLQFKFHNIDCSVLESAIGRGDRRMGDVIEQAYKNGARFDLWDEFFDYRIWQEAFATFSMDLETAAQISFDRHDILPWEHLGGPDKSYLLDHFVEAMKTCSADQIA